MKTVGILLGVPGDAIESLFGRSKLPVGKSEFRLLTVGLESLLFDGAEDEIEAICCC